MALEDRDGLDHHDDDVTIEMVRAALDEYGVPCPEQPLITRIRLFAGVRSGDLHYVAALESRIAELEALLEPDPPELATLNMTGLAYGKCKSCGAEVYWGCSAKSGRPTPVNARPVRNQIVGQRTGKLHTVETWIPHWATCPNAAQHRRREGDG